MGTEQPDKPGLAPRVERLEELAMFGEQAADEAKRSIAALLARVGALADRLAALEERLGKWSEIHQAKSGDGEDVVRES